MARYAITKQIDKCTNCFINKAIIEYQYSGFLSEGSRLLCKKCFDELKRNNNLKNWKM